MRPEPKVSPLQKFVLPALILLFLVFVVSIAAILYAPEKRRVRIVVRATPDLRVNGTLRVDAGAQNFSCITPTNFSFETCNLNFTIQRTGGKGELTVVVFLDGRQRTSLTSDSLIGGVHVEMEHGYFRRSYHAEIFKPAK